MPPEDRTRIVHMIESADAVASFIAGRKREDLDTDLMLLFAVVRAVEVFGEAAARVSAATQAAHPENTLAADRGDEKPAGPCLFRHRPQYLWKAATEEIPALLPTLKMLVHD